MTFNVTNSSFDEGDMSKTESAGLNLGHNKDIKGGSELYHLIGSLILLFSTVMTIIFNGSLLFCILKNRKKQWTRNAHQIVYLILSDFIVGILLLPRNTQILMLQNWIHFSTCVTFSYILSATQAVSFYHIMAVCIHRVRMAIRIHMPFKKDSYNYGRESLIIWMGVLLVLVPPYVFWGRHGETLYKCRFEYVFGRSDTGAMIYLLALYIIPWITTNICYFFVLFKVKRSLKKVHVTNSDSNVPTQTATATSQTPQANKKILKTVGLLLFTFNISIMITMAIILGMLFETVIPHIIQSFVLINNICNPFIYISASSTLKKETGRVLYEIISSLSCTCTLRRQTQTHPSDNPPGVETVEEIELH